MAPFAVAGNPHGTLLLLGDGDVLSLLHGGNVAPDDGVGKIRHHIVGNAALEIQQIALHGLAYKLTAEAALLSVPHRERPVRRKAEHGHGIMFQIVVHILHTGFFSTSQKDPERVGKGLAGFLSQFLEELRQIQCHNGRTLVICHAPSQNVPFPLGQSKGIAAPAVSSGDYIQVGNGGNLFLTFAGDICIDQIAIAVL